MSGILLASSAAKLLRRPPICSRPSARTAGRRNDGLGYEVVEHVAHECGNPLRIGTLWLAGLVASSAGAADGQGTPYTVAELGLIPGAHVTVPFAINNDAHVVGWGQGPGAQVRPFLWTPEAG